MTHVTEFTLGVDLAKNSMEAALAPAGARPEDWRVLPTLHVAHCPESPDAIAILIEWIGRLVPGAPCTLVAVESTGAISKRFAAALRGHGLPEVAIFNPRRIRAYGISIGQREKTDRIDAAMIALYGAHLGPQATPPVRSDADDTLRELSRWREQLVQDVTRWKSRRSEARDGWLRDETERMIEQLEERIKKVDQEIDRRIGEDAALSEQVNWVQQISGLGKVFARTAAAEFGRLDHYGRTEIAARAGLFPKHFESGDSVWKPPRMAKGGGAHLRRVLYMGAVAVMSSNSRLRLWAEKRIAAGRAKMCVIGMLMHKLLLIARAVVISQGRYDESKIGV